MHRIQNLLIDEYRCTGTVDRSRSEDPQDHLIDKYRCTGSLDGWVKMHSTGSSRFCLLKRVSLGSYAMNNLATGRRYCRVIICSKNMQNP